MLVSRI